MKKTIIKKEKAISAMPTFTKVAAYARVSSGKDEMLHSLAAQVSYYSDYIQQHPGWIYVGVYADEAMTGTKDNRPEFIRMLDDCRCGKIDLVLSKSISRFARNSRDVLDLWSAPSAKLVEDLLDKPLEFDSHRLAGCDLHVLLTPGAQQPPDNTTDRVEFALLCRIA